MYLLEKSKVSLPGLRKEPKPSGNIPRLFSMYGWPEDELEEDVWWKLRSDRKAVELDTLMDGWDRGGTWKLQKWLIFLWRLLFNHRASFSILYLACYVCIYGHTLSYSCSYAALICGTASCVFGRGHVCHHLPGKREQCSIFITSRTEKMERKVCCQNISWEWEWRWR